jgi:hypothetical protein
MMSLSTIVVAANAQLLRRLRLRPDDRAVPAAHEPEGTPAESRTADATAGTVRRR